MSDHAGIAIARTEPRSIAGIGVLGARDALLEALRAEFGAVPPVTSRFIAAGYATLFCLAPKRYLVMADREAGLLARLAPSLAGFAAITDQSDMWTCFSLSGAHVRDVLARVVPIDLTPARFQPGDLALTRAGHMDVRLWRVAENGYELAVIRSCAGSLLHHLHAAC